MQGGDRGWQQDGREEASTTGGEHGQHPLFTGDTHHVTGGAGGWHQGGWELWWPRDAGTEPGGRQS